MSMEEREILVMGLPAAGKTTFIAALWHVVWAIVPTLVS
jgi:GTPase SAR1 family protein